MKNGRTLADLIREQIQLEKETTKKFSTLEPRLDSPVAGLLIREMQLDTKKRAEILESALKVIGGPKSAIIWEDGEGQPSRPLTYNQLLHEVELFASGSARMIERFVVCASVPNQSPGKLGGIERVVGIGYLANRCPFIPSIISLALAAGTANNISLSYVTAKTRSPFPGNTT